MTSRRDFITDFLRYLVAGILALFAALLIGRKSIPDAQGSPCNLKIKCSNCTKSSNCPYIPAQQAGRQ